MAASAVFILDHRGKILISRNYRGDIPMGVATRFVARVLEEEEMNVKPIVEEDGVTYIFVKHNNLFLLATTDRNGNAAVTLLFLYKIVQVLVEYFKELEEESIKDNFVIIYELLDEMMDFGYPQTTEPKVLQEYITQSSYKLDRGTPTVPIAATGGVSWRTENVKYRRNEVFLDVIESVNYLVSANGTVLRAEIIGSIKVNSKLSGMPELRLGLNDKVHFETSGEKKDNPSRSVELEDVKFHQCVRLTRFEVDHVITFVPPDGDFILMSYRLNTTVKPLFWIDTNVTKHSKNRIEYLIKAKSQYKPQSIANNVQILVPVPADASAPTFQCSMGSCKYVPEKDAVVWGIKQFPGLKEPTMRLQYTLPSVRNEESPDKRPPVTVKFEIPYYTVSGIQVRYLKIIEKSGYASLPWVRYLCMSGDYQFRI
jgi:AP-1 complex subunit mu